MNDTKQVNEIMIIARTHEFPPWGSAIPLDRRDISLYFQQLMDKYIKEKDKCETCAASAEDLKEAESEIEDLKDDNSDLQGEIDDLESDIYDFKKEIKELENDIKQLKKELIAQKD